MPPATAAQIKVGDLVQLIAIPDGLPQETADGELDTRGLFQRCLGRSFPIVSLDDRGRAELEVGEVDGLPPYYSSIWVEREYLAVVERVH